MPVEPRKHTARPTWFSRLLRAILVVAKITGKFLLFAWTTCAIYFSNLPWEWLKVTLALCFAGFAIWSLWITKRPKMKLAFTAVFLCIIGWYAMIPASHDRDWRREVASMPHATIDGDLVTLHGVRNFSYESATEFTEHYEDRQVMLSHLTSVDLYISYWAVGPVGHTFVSFNFDNAPPVCISIETRPEVGEGFAPLASLFKQFELIYVVGDEKDLVGSRTKHRNEEVFLYPIKSSPEAARRLFMVYLERINELAEKPEWYHLLKNSCTINIVRYKNAAGRDGSLDIRHVLNGWIDRYYYDTNMIDTSLPFDQSRERAHINDVANESLDDPEFSRIIREHIQQ